MKFLHKRTHSLDDTPLRLIKLKPPLKVGQFDSPLPYFQSPVSLGKISAAK